MDLQERTRRFGVYVILCACALRFALAGGPGWAARWLADAEHFPFLTYLETGRNVRFSSSLEKTPHAWESPPPQLPPAALPCFGAEAAALIGIDDDCGLMPEVLPLLEAPLSWNLADGQPRVLILHTHATESYTRMGEDYIETARYRTLDEQYNMVSLGDAAAELLEEAGIGVIHDRQLHDYPSYNGSYVHARSAIEEALLQYPTIRLVLDLHRDALAEGGSQLRTEATVDGQTAAQLMFVLGTDASRPSHINWQENLSLALKLQALLEQQSPGIMRPLNLRSQRFNQDLSPGALLVEVGAAGNTHAEAMLALRELTEAVIRLSKGTADNRSN